MFLLNVIIIGTILESSQDAVLLKQRHIPHLCVVFRMTVGHGKEAMENNLQHGMSSGLSVNNIFPKPSF